MKQRLLGLTAAAAAQSDLVQTSVWNVLRQRFFALALERPSVANAEGWTDLPVSDVAAAVDVLLSGYDVSRSTEDDGSRAWLGTRDDEAALVQFDADGGWRAVACGTSESTVGEQLGRISAAFPLPNYAGEASVSVRFWALGSMGPISYQRRLDASPWTDAQANYPSGVRAELDKLMSAGPPTSGGKLLLMYGPPGTGKTRVTESLASAWADWCDVDFVIDADNFFGVAAYMVSSMVMGADDRWRLVVLEDSGEFLAAKSDDRPTQGLSRLLNLADGMVGQGLKVLVLMTTNEDVSELHPAVTRPGRCMAKIAFEAFDADEANTWLSDSGKVADGPMTLAELYAEVAT